jgi:putative NADH-flavin reductase
VIRAARKNFSCSTPELQPWRTRHATRTKQAAPIDKESTAHERKRALSKKGTAVRSIADTKSYADILGEIPALSNCTREVLDEFVATTDCTVHAAVGAEPRSPAHSDHSLYVLVGGSASLQTDDDVRVLLQPGDYFGGAAARRHENVISSVVAHEDAEFIVIGPAQVLQLRHASTRRSHPSNMDWVPEPLSPSATFVPRRRRFAVLANSPS